MAIANVGDLQPRAHWETNFEFNLSWVEKTKAAFRVAETKCDIDVWLVAAGFLVIEADYVIEMR
ncbi:MAG: hypothetical protein Aurels2KO_41530 [Aureliella sp.]